MSEKQFDFPDFLRFLKKMTALLIVVPIFFGVIAFAYFYLTYVPTYTATATVACNAKQSATGNMDSSSYVSSQQMADLVKYLMKKESTLTNALDILQANDDNIDYTSYTAASIGGMISVDIAEDTFFIEVSAVSPSRKVATDVANAVAEAGVSLAGTDGVLGVGNVSVIQPATTPETASSSNITFKALVSAFAGFAIAFIITFILYVTDDRIKNQEDVLSKYNVSILGLIPPQRNQ